MPGVAAGTVLVFVLSLGFYVTPAVLRGGRVTTALIGASKVSQIEDCAGAVANLEFTDEELTAIDGFAVNDNLINLWAKSSEEV